MLPGVAGVQLAPPSLLVSSVVGSSPAALEGSPWRTATRCLASVAVSHTPAAEGRPRPGAGAVVQVAPWSPETAREYSSAGLAADGQTPRRVPGALAVAETHTPVAASHPVGSGSGPALPLSRMARPGPTAFVVVTL